MRTFITIICVSIVSAIIAGLGFLAGVAYVDEYTRAIYCEGICATMSELDVNEQSDNLVLTGEGYGECEGLEFVITRTK